MSVELEDVNLLNPSTSSSSAPLRRHEHDPDQHHDDDVFDSDLELEDDELRYGRPSDDIMNASRKRFCGGCALVIVLLLLASFLPVFNADSSDDDGVDAPDEPDEPAPVTDGFGSAQRVLVVGLDGFGGAWWNSSSHPALSALSRRGAFSMRARGVLPESSGPNWATILLGAGPEEHGVDANRWYPPPSDGCVKYGLRFTYCAACAACKDTVAALRAHGLSAPVAELDDIALANCPWSALHCGNTTLDYPHLLVNETQRSPESEPAELICRRVTIPSTSSYTACREHLTPFSSTTSPFPSLFHAVRRGFPDEATHATMASTDHSTIIPFLEPDSVATMIYERNATHMLTRFRDYVDGAVTNGTLPRLLFAHIDLIDHVGHLLGFGSPQYLDEMRVVDDYVAHLLATLERHNLLDDTLVVVCGDHGGSPTGARQLNQTGTALPSNHGYTDNYNLHVPWIAAGPGTRHNAELSSYVRLADIAPTVVHALGTQPFPEWTGRAVREVWQADAAPQPLPNSDMDDSIAVVVDLSGLSFMVAGNASFAPTLAADLADGSDSFAGEARATMPCTPETNLASILTGTGPEEHGVCHGRLTWVTCTYGPLLSPPQPPDLWPLMTADTMWQDELTRTPILDTPPDAEPRPPTVFDIAKVQQPGQPAHSTNTSLFYRSTALLDALVPDQGHIDVRHAGASDEEVVSQFETFAQGPMATSSWLSIVELTGAREAGDQFGYDSPEFFAAARAVDAQYARVKAALAASGRAHLVVATADRGGAQSFYGGTNDDCMLVPFVASGTRVRAVHSSTKAHLRNFDASTLALYVLGVGTPAHVQGSSISNIFAHVDP